MSSFSSRYHSPELFARERKLARQDSRRRAREEARGMDQTATVEVLVKRLTARAALLHHVDLDRDGWVPLSCIEQADDLPAVEQDQPIEVTVALWKLNELGWA